jgi:cadmium resistance protein CadD (predicted permease)
VVDIVGLIAIGVSAFAATNIDDIFVLMMFFSSLSYPIRHIILGQYLGIGSLIGISIVGSLISLVVPTYVIGLMGIAPIAIGVKHLIEKRIKGNTSSRHVVEDKNRPYLSFLSVAAVTFSNGGDNIGVYVPLFSKYNAMGEITVLTSVFLAMTAVWCVSAYYFVNHPIIASRIHRIGNIVLPFVLIGLGIYILMDSFLFV